MSKNRDGREYPDPTPVEWPLKLKRPPSIQEMIRQYVRSQLSQVAADQGAESFEEFHDFDVDEDDEVITQHELAAMSPEEFGVDPDAEVIDKGKGSDEPSKSAESGTGAVPEVRVSENGVVVPKV